MATSSVEICNSALHKIGAARITSLSDTSKQAIILNDQYDRLRKEVLRGHPWNFAIAFVALSATVNTPIWSDWSTEFLVPSDVLRVLETDLTQDQPWEIGYNVDGNKVLFCQSDSVTIKYVKNVTDTTLFDACFEEALAYRLAADLAYSLVQSQTVQQAMMAEYRKVLATAMSFDAQEKSQDTIIADEWTLIRG